MKLIIDSRNSVSKNLHLNIAGFSIDASDLSDSGVIGISIDDSGDFTIDISTGDADVVDEAAVETSNDTIPDIQAPIVQDLLFVRLSDLRRKIAHESGLPPYYIFHDSSLKAMSASLPVDMDSMKVIPGVGKKKLDKYGDRFISVIKEYIAESA